MKKLAIFLLIFFSFITINAEITREKDTFKAETTQKQQDTQTKYTWIDNKNTEYPIYITKKGRCYIIRTSKKSGKEYKYYLPQEVQEQIQQELNNNTQEQ